MDLFISAKYSSTMSEESEEPAQEVMISEEQYKLCAVTCLFISAKSFEIEDLVPKSAQLMKFMTDDPIPGEYPNICPLISDCERQVLNTLDWDFEREPTFNSILENFLAMGILVHED